MNNYSVIVLGPSGCGKSIFLASLFHVFSTQGKFGFFLRVKDPEKQKILNKIHTDLTIGEDWPPGTQGISEWQFTCYFQDLKACTITYIDYAGGHLTDTDISKDQEKSSIMNDITDYAKEADSVLAILDGQKLLEFMKDKDLSNKNVIRWKGEHLSNLMLTINNICDNKDISVNFMISKWDLLQGRYSLLEIKERLLKDVELFNDVVGRRTRANCQIRLIPVSSLGSDFAIFQDGKMKKRSVKPDPINVEACLAFALTGKPRNQSGRAKQKSFKVTVWDWAMIGFLFFITMTLYSTMNLLSVYTIVPGLIIAIIYFAFRLILKRNNRNTKQRANKTLSSEEAFEQILIKCEEIKKKFAQEFPDSDLAVYSDSNS
ncbi:MAG: hypothetical protein U7127_08400 [Phormidium sp.]